MSKLSDPTTSGKAWEYGLARRLAERLNVPLIVDKPSESGRKAHAKLPERDRENALLAAAEAVKFLVASDGRFAKGAQNVRMQSDQRGGEGDVRDIIVTAASGEIGLSAKHRHADLKHPRLSTNIDWPQLWTGENATPEYWQDINPIFDYLANAGVDKWRDLPDKLGAVYLPLLNAFMSELTRQYDRRGAVVARNLMRYMIGKYDFYKVMKENGQVSIQSFNLNNSLSWGKRIALPTEVIRAQLKPNSTTTVFVTFNHGWALSMRIHSAETRITSSLKFAVGLEGQPPTLSNHTINYLGR